MFSRAFHGLFTGFSRAFHGLFTDLRFSPFCSFFCSTNYVPHITDHALNLGQWCFENFLEKAFPCLLEGMVAQVHDRRPHVSHAFSLMIMITKKYIPLRPRNKHKDLGFDHLFEVMFCNSTAKTNWINLCSLQH